MFTACDRRASAGITTAPAKVDGEKGAVTLNGQPITSRDELGDLISSRLQGRDKKVVFVDFDDDAKYGVAVEILDLAKQSGAEVLGIMKNKDKKTPDTLRG